jgi:acyl-coenzyme A synthetase/AMP-(fatty) acid ligase
VAPGDIVGIHVHDQARHLVASLALARLGAGQVTFIDFDPPMLQKELARRLRVVATVADRSAKVVAETPLIAPPPASLEDCKRLMPVEFKAAQDGTLPFIALSTSGTTGAPKLCMLTHAATYARNRLCGLELADPADGRFVSLVNINFAGAKQRVYRRRARARIIGGIRRRRRRGRSRASSASRCPASRLRSSTKRKISCLGAAPAGSA